MTYFRKTTFLGFMVLTGLGCLTAESFAAAWRAPAIIRPSQDLIKDALTFVKMPPLTLDLIKNPAPVAFVEPSPLPHLEAFEGRVVDASEGKETKEYLSELKDKYNLEIGRILETYSSMISQQLKRTTPENKRYIRQVLEAFVSDNQAITFPKLGLSSAEQGRLDGLVSKFKETVVEVKFILNHISQVVGVALSVAPNVTAIVCNEKQSKFDVPTTKYRDLKEQWVQSFNNAARSDAKVVNMSFSWGTTHQETVDAFKNLVLTGKLIVVAAANSGKDLGSDEVMELFSSVGYFDNVIYVVNVDSSSGIRASSSNYPGGKFWAQAISAPGSGLQTILGNGRLEKASGTSLSAPIVSGAAGFLSALFQNRQGDELAFLIKESATPTSNPTELGRGILNVTGAMELGKMLRDYPYITQEIAQMAFNSNRHQDPTLYPEVERQALKELPLMTQMIRDSLSRKDYARALTIADDRMNCRLIKIESKQKKLRSLLTFK